LRDARSAAVEARKAMLERVGLRHAESEPGPQSDLAGDALSNLGPQLEQVVAAGRAVDGLVAALRSEMAETWGSYRPRYITGLSSTETGLSHDAYRGGQRASVHAMYDPITWPDEGYPCQLCWAVKRWPWEPMRSCPISMDVESTYCEKHGGKAAGMQGTEPSFVVVDESDASWFNEWPPPLWLMQVIEPTFRVTYTAGA
jgi:hypothetical protein